MSTITFSQAKQGYLLAAGACHLSEHTIRDYVNTLTKFSNFLGHDLPIDEINRHHIEAFFAAQTKVTNKTILNYHVGLSSLWTWAVSEHIVPTHVVREVTPPKPEQKEIVPFTVVEIRAMLAVVGRDTTGQVSNQYMKASADRNRAILLLLLDTGMRASELCGLNFSHVDNHNRRVRVMGKGSKERTIPFSPRTGQVLWRYLTIRGNPKKGDPLFVTKTNRSLNRQNLLKLLNRIGERANVTNVYPIVFVTPLRFNTYAMEGILTHCRLCSDIQPLTW